MWKITEHKSPRSKQALEVAVILKEIATYEGVTYSESFINLFEKKIQEIPRNNIYAAHLFHKLTPRNLYSLELWKLDAQGEFKEKLYTLNYQKDDKD